VGYLGDRIEEHVRKHYGNLDLHFVKQEEMLGLGHAIAICGGIHRKDDRILIILGDTIVRADFRKMFANPDSTLAVKPVDDPRRFGTVQVEKGTDRITGLVEKAENPPTNLAIVGVYLLSNAGLLFDSLDKLIKTGVQTKGEYQLTDALAMMLDSGHVMRTFEIEEWLDCGKPETLLSTNRRILELEPCRLDEYRRQHPTCVFVPPVTVGENCVLENSVVGPYVSMAHDVSIRNSIVEDSTIGRFSALASVNIKASMIGEHTVVESLSGSLNIGDHTVISGRG
jgi:glucose-1-phosphate thymidylyltransferase